MSKPSKFCGSNRRSSSNKSQRSSNSIVVLVEPATGLLISKSSEFCGANRLSNIFLELFETVFDKITFQLISSFITNYYWGFYYFKEMKLKSSFLIQY